MWYKTASDTSFFIGNRTKPEKIKKTRKIKEEKERIEYEKRRMEENGQIIISSSCEENSVKEVPAEINKKESIFRRFLKIFVGR